MKSALRNRLQKRLDKLNADAARLLVRLPMRDGTSEQLAATQLHKAASALLYEGIESAESDALLDADPDKAASDGSRLHALLQMIEDTLEQPFIPCTGV